MGLFPAVAIHFSPGIVESIHAPKQQRLGRKDLCQFQRHAAQATPGGPPWLGQSMGKSTSHGGLWLEKSSNNGEFPAIFQRVSSGVQEFMKLVTNLCCFTHGITHVGWKKNKSIATVDGPAKSCTS